MKTTLSLTIIAFFFAVTSNALGFDFSLSEKDLKCIGDRVFQNECSGNPEKLVYWDAREPFPSLGIGHFIWYPENFKGRFHESFPELIRFLKNNGAAIPDWLWSDRKIKFPWHSREEFLANKDSPRMSELKRLLENTMDLQTLFMLERLKRFESKIFTFPFKSMAHERFKKLASTTQGVYVLMDYLNFKGSGLDGSEKYKEQGWGLKQVLEEMDEDAFQKAPIEEFSRTTIKVLEKGVMNSTPEDKEYLRLIGWKNRILSYSKFSC